MNRSHAHLMARLMRTILIGSLLICGLGPSNADDEASRATPPPAVTNGTTEIAALQSPATTAVASTWQLASLDGRGNVSSVHFEPAPLGVIYATSAPALPRTFALPTQLSAANSAWNQTCAGRKRTSVREV